MHKATRSKHPRTARVLPLLIQMLRASIHRLSVNQSQNLRKSQPPKRKSALMRARRRVSQSQIRVPRSLRVKATTQLPHKMEYFLVFDEGDGVDYGHLGRRIDAIVY
jgi:hypothetical protein